MPLKPGVAGATATMQIEHPPSQVWAVLADPWRFADWVVGAKVIRAVDADWPALGSRFHHRFGVGPLTIDDSTVLEAYEPQRRMVLRARARPTGVARVVIELVPTADGTEVHLEEHPVSGFAKTVDNPVLRALVVARNHRSLRRLARLVGDAEQG
jgi:uncharacterized protein YndB with AHSA1/START domain